MFIDVEVQMILYIYKKIIVSRAGHDNYAPLPWRCDVIMRVTLKLQMRATGTIFIVET